MERPTNRKGEDMDKLTMTVNETMDDMRRNGIRMSPKKFNFMVDSGMFPFVKIVRVNTTGRRTQLIMRQEYQNWLKSVLEVNT